MLYLPDLPDLINPLVLFWFRRDLRLTDNHGLYQALKQNCRVLPVFIFDTLILEQLVDPTDQRVNFIYTQLQQLQQELEQQGSSLLIGYGQPLEIYRALMDKHPFKQFIPTTIMNLMP